jgi:murein DD-endopeptidase MepM/ murein hydrolase activator NlpD
MVKRKVIFGMLIICLLALNSCNGIKNPDTRGYMMKSPVLLQIPVHAFFICPNTPGSKIPSHGIDKYGVEYAIDFVILDDSAKSQKPYRSSFFTYMTKGLPLSDFYGYGIEIYSPVKGVVVQVVDGMDERNPVNVVDDLRYAAEITRSYKENLVDPKYLLGNSVIIKTNNLEYIVLAHLQKNSIVVKPGQSVDSSTVIGKLGHSGNSTMPHLHLQAMDDLDFRKAKGIPIVFSQYSVIKKGETVDIRDSIPEKDEIMFFTK